MRQTSWSAQDLVDTPFLLSNCCGFEAVGAHSVQVTMAAHRIVERFDMVGDVRQRKRSGLVDLLLDPFFLQAAKKGFGHGVVPAVSLAALEPSVEAASRDFQSPTHGRNVVDIAIGLHELVGLSRLSRAASSGHDVVPQ